MLDGCVISQPSVLHTQSTNLLWYIFQALAWGGGGCWTACGGGGDARQHEGLGLPIWPCFCSILILLAAVIDVNTLVIFKPWPPPVTNHLLNHQSCWTGSNPSPEPIIPRRRRSHHCVLQQTASPAQRCPPPQPGLRSALSASL